MNIHEYQAKKLLRHCGVSVPQGKIAFSAEEAEKIAMKFYEKGVRLFVAKAQIHAGGRGKGRTINHNVKGVVLCSNAKEIKEIAQKMLHDRLVTKQTGPEGQKIHRVFITEGVDIEHEFYLSIMPDRGRNSNVIIVSREGGMDIERVAEDTPEKIIREWIHPGMDIEPHHARRLAFALDPSGVYLRKLSKYIMDLYHAYINIDASLLEVNPMVITPEGEVLAIDAKVTLDNNAFYRHTNYLLLRDEGEESPLEIEASNHNLNYVKLDGNVGCMVNGAGLAMATMDIIKLYGGSPANFLDIGGSANQEIIKNGFRILLSESNVKAILINIFGGIVRCDWVAEGILDAMKDDDISEKVSSIPVVVRLQGNKAVEARELLAQSDMNVIPAMELDESAEKVVQMLN